MSNELLQIQAQQLEEWETKLNKECYNALLAYAQQSDDIVRGVDFDNFINNWKPSTTEINHAKVLTKSQLKTRTQSTSMRQQNDHKYTYVDLTYLCNSYIITVYCYQKGASIGAPEYFSCLVKARKRYVDIKNNIKLAMDNKAWY